MLRLCCSTKRIEVRKFMTAVAFAAFVFVFTVTTIIQTYPHLTTMTLNNLKRTRNCCSQSYWDAILDAKTLTGEHILQYAMWTNSLSCKLSHDFGGVLYTNPSVIDGQKAICLDSEVAPNPDDCLVYSFGINNEWSFDEQMEKYGCQVFSFDPSMGIESHDHSPGIHFYNWGLGDRFEITDRFWILDSLSSIYNNLTARHGNKIIDYLKIDVEFAEWTALPQIIESGMLSKVRQLGVEIHLRDKESIEKNFGYVKIIRSIEEMGFVRFDSKYNPWSITNFTEFGLIAAPCCFEIAWYNGKLSNAKLSKSPYV